MHPASEPLLIRNALQKSDELPLFVLGDSGKQCLRMFAGNAADRLTSRHAGPHLGMLSWAMIHPGVTQDLTATPSTVPGDGDSTMAP